MNHTVLLAPLRACSVDTHPRIGVAARNSPPTCERTDHVSNASGQITCQRQEKPANSFVSAPEPVALGDTLGPGGMPEG